SQLSFISLSRLSKKTKAPQPDIGRGALENRQFANCYFATGAVVASFLRLVFLLTFFVCLLVFTAGFASVVGVLPAAGGLAWLPAWCAANIGMEATAKAITIKLFFIFFFSLAGRCPLTNPSCGACR